MKIWQDFKLSFLPLPTQENCSIFIISFNLGLNLTKNHLQNISLIKGFPKIPLKTFILDFIKFSMTKLFDIQ
jgi:hypothetical protein